MLVDMLSMGIVTSIHENIKSNPLKKDYGVLWSIRSRFHFVADTHNPYKKFLLSSYKGIKQAVRHQSDGSPEDAIPLDKRYDITTQDILWNLHHQVVYRHHITPQRHETAFPVLDGTISECWLQGYGYSARLVRWTSMAWNIAIPNPTSFIPNKVLEQ